MTDDWEKERRKARMELKQLSEVMPLRDGILIVEDGSIELGK